MRFARMPHQLKKQGRLRELLAFASPRSLPFLSGGVSRSFADFDNRVSIKERPAEDFAGSQVGLEFDLMMVSDLPVLTDNPRGFRDGPYERTDVDTSSM